MLGNAKWDSQSRTSERMVSISELCAVTTFSVTCLAYPFRANNASPNLCCAAHRTDRLPPLNARLAEVRVRSPIEQHMLGHSCLYRQQNTEKRKAMSVREMVRVVCKDDLRAPGVDDV